VTQPVQEPLTQRSISNLAWRTGQLERRPTPSGEAGIPGFHGYRTQDITLVSANDNRINWDFWIIDDDTIFDVAVFGGDATDVALLVEGWYSVNVWAGFSNDPATGFAGIMLQHDATVVAAPDEGMGVTYPINFHTQSMLSFAKTAYYPPEFQTTDDSFAWVDRLEFYVVQNSGINRTITWAWCNIAYLGPRESTPTS
jgi:hypothetical protein